MRKTGKNFTLFSKREATFGEWMLHSISRQRMFFLILGNNFPFTPFLSKRMQQIWFCELWRTCMLLVFHLLFELACAKNKFDNCTLKWFKIRIFAHTHKNQLTSCWGARGLTKGTRSWLDWINSMQKIVQAFNFSWKFLWIDYILEWRKNPLGFTHFGNPNQTKNLKQTLLGGGVFCVVHQFSFWSKLGGGGHSLVLSAHFLGLMDKK